LSVYNNINHINVSYGAVVIQIVHPVHLMKEC